MQSKKRASLADPSCLSKICVGCTWTLSGPQTTEIAISSSYQNAFEGASRDLERAIVKASFSDIQAAITKGIASIEAFLRLKADDWNRQNPRNPLVDSKRTKVRFDDKIDKWVPLMTGQKVDQGGRHWQDFTKLLMIRDDQAIHIKESGRTVSYQNLAELVNAFATGIAGVLLDLHLQFRTIVPSIIIRAHYAPECSVIRTN